MWHGVVAAPASYAHKALCICGFLHCFNSLSLQLTASSLTVPSSFISLSHLHLSHCPIFIYLTVPSSFISLSHLHLSHCPIFIYLGLTQGNTVFFHYFDFIVSVFYCNADDCEKAAPVRFLAFPTGFRAWHSGLQVAQDAGVSAECLTCFTHEYS